MLLIMVPLVAAASTQPDFLAMYPKLKSITGIYEINSLTPWHKLIYELSYGSDFISIELFFRGFLVLGIYKMGRQGCDPSYGLFLLHDPFWKTIG